MPRESVPLPKLHDTYRSRTHQPLTCLVFLLPMLLFFHIGSSFYNISSLLAVRDMGRLLSVFGAGSAQLAVAVLLVGVLLLAHLMSGQSWKVQPKVLGGMAVESIVWMLPLIAMAMLNVKVLAATWGEQAVFVMKESLIAVGAGIYEEFLFRLAFIGLAVLLLVKVFGLKKEPVSIAAVVVAGICFSLYHFHWRQFGGTMVFPWHDFIFRFAAGVYLGGIYLVRGFGIAVGTHAAYDLYLVVLMVNSPAAA